MSHISGSTAALGCARGSCPLPGQGAFCCVPCAVLLCGPGVSTANSCQPACGCVAPWCPVACNQACSCSPNCCMPVCCQPAVCEIPSCTGLLCCILPCC